MNSSLAQCSLAINTTLPLVCICSLFSFLCGVGIGANDLSANFAMVVGSGSLDMRKAIVYCTVFELLGAAFMGGHVSSTIRNGIVQPELFKANRDVVVVGMTAASFAAALWLYLSTVFGLPVSITHTVVGSLLGYAVFSTFSFDYVKTQGLVVIVVSWVAAPLAACAVTATVFYYLRRDVFKVKGRSFELALRVLPACLLVSLLVDYAFVVIEEPPIMTQTFAKYVPVFVQFGLLLLLIGLFCYAAHRLYFPHVVEEAWAASSFVWESRSLRTEAVDLPPGKATEAVTHLDNRLSFFAPPRLSSSSSSDSDAGEGGGGEARGRRATARVPPNTGNSAAVREEASLSLLQQQQQQQQAECDSGLPPALSHSASHASNRGAAGGVLGSSVVLASITPSDSRVFLGRSVRLAPTGRRSPLPSASGRGTPGGSGVSLGASANAAGSGCTSSGLYRPPHLMPEVVALTPRVAADGPHRSSSRLTGRGEAQRSASGYGATDGAGTPHNNGNTRVVAAAVVIEPSSPTSVHSDNEFGDEDWALDHPMEPIRFGGLLIKPFNPRAEYLFTSLQVVAGSMSSFVHGAVAGANATATFVVLYEAFSNHELGEPNLESRWSVLPAMLGIAIGMFALGASLMKTVGMELVTVTPVRGWSIQVGGTAVTMILTGLGIPVSLSQSQVGAAIGCGVLDAKMAGVSWSLVAKIVGGWVVTLVISAATTGLVMWFLFWILC